MRMRTTITATLFGIALAAAAAGGSTASAASTLCTPGRLQVSLGPAQGGMNATATTFVFTNVSGRTCVLSGYPGMAFIGGKGAMLAKRVIRGGTKLFKDPGARVVPLEPTGTSSFTVGTTMPQATTCPLTMELAITPPGGTTPLFIGTPGARGLYVCPGRVPVVSAVVPGARGALR